MKNCQIKRKHLIIKEQLRLLFTKNMKLKIRKKMLKIIFHLKHLNIQANLKKIKLKKKFHFLIILVEIN